MKENTANLDVSSEIVEDAENEDAEKHTSETVSSEDIGIGIEVEDNEFSHTGMEASQSSYDLERPNTAFVKMKNKMTCSRVGGFLLGIVFFCSATYVGVTKTPEDSHDEVWRFLVAIGALFTFPIVGDLILYIAVFILNYSIMKQKKSERQQVNNLSEIVLVLTNDSFYWARLIWTGLVLFTLLIIRPYSVDKTSDSTGLTWSSAMVRFLRDLVLLLFMCTIARILVIGICRRLTTHFNSRGYAATAYESLVIEQTLMTTGAYDFHYHRVGSVLMEKVNRCVALYPISDRRNASLRQLLFRYVREHRLDGSKIENNEKLKKEHEKEKELSDRRVQRMSKRIMSHLRDLVGKYSSHLKKDEDQFPDTTLKKEEVVYACRKELERRKKRIGQGREQVENNNRFQFEPEEVWERLDRLDRGVINEKYLENQIHVYDQERENLVSSLVDAFEVVNSLDFVVSIIIYTMTIFLFMGIIAGSYVSSGSDSGLSFALAAIGVLMSLNFVFGTSLTTAFNSLVFVFFIHPYDVGDIVQLGSASTKFTVKKVSLLTTQMLRWDGAFVKFENHTMMSKQSPIINLTTSAPYSHSFHLDVDIQCVNQKFLDNIKKDVETFLEQNSDKFLTTGMSLTARELKDCFKVRITLCIDHVFSNINTGRIFKHNSLALIMYMDSLNRNGALYTLPNKEKDVDRTPSKSSTTS